MASKLYAIHFMVHSTIIESQIWKQEDGNLFYDSIGSKIRHSGSYKDLETLKADQKIEHSDLAFIYEIPKNKREIGKLILNDITGGQPHEFTFYTEDEVSVRVLHNYGNDERFGSIDKVFDSIIGYLAEEEIDLLGGDIIEY